MLDPKMIPSRLVEPAEVKPVDIREPNKPSRFHLFYLAALFSRFGLQCLWLKLRGRLTSREYAHRLRAVFEQLGGLWVKLGQLLSLRSDVFSREFCQELA